MDRLYYSAAKPSVVEVTVIALLIMRITKMKGCGTNAPDTDTHAVADKGSGKGLAGRPGIVNIFKS